MSSDLIALLRERLAVTRSAGPRPLAPEAMNSPGGQLLLDSRIVQALRPSAVLAPILRRGGRHTILLTRRSEHLRAHGGQVSFPGGRTDEDDRDAVDTALREAEEEIGLPRSAVEVLGYLDDYPTFSNFRITPVVGVVDEVPDWQLHPHEVAEAFELPLDWVLDPAHYRRELMEKDGVQYSFWELDYPLHRVWGATAGMLHNLSELYHGRSGGRSDVRL